MKLVKRGQTGGGQAPNLTGVLIKKKKFGHRDGHEERHHLNMKADIQVMLLSQGLPADHQKLERGLDRREMYPAHTGVPDFRPPGLRDNKALLSSCPICGALSQLPQETDTASWGHSSAQHCVPSTGQPAQHDLGHRTTLPRPQILSSKS